MKLFGGWIPFIGWRVRSIMLDDDVPSHVAIKKAGAVHSVDVIGIAVHTFEIMWLEYGLALAYKQTIIERGEDK
jgi:hypothetical protein